jgi:DNA-binding NarL/FixJ family response regulator
VIRVIVVDDHPALRAGLHTVLDSEPGIAYAGESNGSEESLWPLLRRVEPDVVLLDYHLPKGDGLQLCYRIKHHVPAPGVGRRGARALRDHTRRGRRRAPDRAAFTRVAP